MTRFVIVNSISAKAGDAIALVCASVSSCGVAVLERRIFGIIDLLGGYFRAKLGKIIVNCKLLIINGILLITLTLNYLRVNN